jgi:hypothetical protein
MHRSVVWGIGRSIGLRVCSSGAEGKSDSREQNIHGGDVKRGGESDD